MYKYREQMNIRAQKKIFEKSWHVFQNQRSKLYNADGTEKEEAALTGTMV